jgi:hypothetical protein
MCRTRFTEAQKTRTRRPSVGDNGGSKRSRRTAKLPERFECYHFRGFITLLDGVRCSKW